MYTTHCKHNNDSDNHNDDDEDDDDENDHDFIGRSLPINKNNEN